MAKFNEGDYVVVNDNAAVDVGRYGTVTDGGLGAVSVKFLEGGNGCFYEAEVTLVKTAYQQLADAVARAERAERQVAVLKAFVVKMAELAPPHKPQLDDHEYYSGGIPNIDWNSYLLAEIRWSLSQDAQATLKAVEDKAVGDGTDNAPTEAR